MGVRTGFHYFLAIVFVIIVNHRQGWLIGLLHVEMEKNISRSRTIQMPYVR